MAAGVTPRQFLLVMGLVLLIRIPFLNQAIQGDDHIYLPSLPRAHRSLHPDDTVTCFRVWKSTCAANRIRLWMRDAGRF